MAETCSAELEKMLEDWAKFETAFDEFKGAEFSLDMAEMDMPLGCMGSIPLDDPECEAASENISEAREALEDAEKDANAAAEQFLSSLGDLVKCGGKHVVESLREEGIID